MPEIQAEALAEARRRNTPQTVAYEMLLDRCKGLSGYQLMCLVEVVEAFYLRREIK